MSPCSVFFLFSYEFDYSYIHENSAFSKLKKCTTCHFLTYKNTGDLQTLLANCVNEWQSHFIVLVEPRFFETAFNTLFDCSTINLLETYTLPIDFYARINNQSHLLVIDSSDSTLTDLCMQIITYTETLMPDTLHSLSATLGRILMQHHYTLASAESCSGGLIAKTITDVSGASAYFPGGACTYSAKAKINILGVPESIILNSGIVSHATARAMALGACKVFQTDIALSTTGVAGPGPDSDGNQEGLVYIGIAIGEQCYTYQLIAGENCVFTDRDFIRHHCVAFALKKLIKLLTSE